VVVTNSGRVAAEEVAQLYVSGLRSSVRAPRAALKGFRRVRLGPGEAGTVEFAVEPSMLVLVDEAGRERVEKGEFRLTIGGASPGARAVALGAPEPAQATLIVR
jgi:beta-glucosidase